MKEYCALQNTLCNNFKQVNIQLNQFNYDYHYGTLLHGAVRDNFVGYAELLLSDGFDPNKNNRNHKTPVSLAHRNEGFLMKSLFKDVIEHKESNEDEKKEKENENEKCEEGQMDVGSLSLRYDVCFVKHQCQECEWCAIY